jgi:hypothetical protein
MKKMWRGVALALCVTASSSGLADDPVVTPAPATTAVPAYAEDMLNEFDGAAKEILLLAEATPAEKFGWRPAEGVRSVSEVYMHVAGGNYLLVSFLGDKPPMPLSRDMEKTVTEKAKVVEFLKGSFDHVRKSLKAKSESDLAKPAKFFGRESTARAIYLRLVVHNWEHLGQAVGYARMNGIVPPWSEKKR